MNGVNRRDATAWALSAGALLCAGRGGGLDAAATTLADDLSPAPSPPPVADLPAWNMQQVWAFVAGAPASVDLAETLPAGLARGGRFGVHASGAPLAAGMTLTADGLLSVAAGTPVGATSGVVFEYSKP